ncbi:hypothetical protein I8J29_05870 [Paenibacillus sp. MWE-103]|uniref:YD repeat-containing protein n=1 Tax=Paenibacillus artemisiicola TaxID=1172618 RepID=A0ABS3W5X6_9BACL|nr:SpvB/TcaC N-terminal domain-containing protein [Paenibacillus artemisiicola]MBO7743715.1 hypothetical protein [Paenibacillus artemisiicola]
MTTPSITLPKGGGAIRAMGEKFAANPVTGTGSMSVPLHWRSISKDNILTLYGYDANSRIADPLDASRIFSWLICESRDDKGNGIRYLYKKEDGACQPRPGQADPFNQVHQRNRGHASDPRRTAQRYLQRVLYGNLKPLLDAQGRRPRYLSDLPPLQALSGSSP